MSLALYRKYRPQNFAEITNQNHIKITLQNEIASGKVAHAYLFTGPRGVGKTTVARILAKAVNCLERKKDEAEPCSHCSACREIVEGRAVDVMEIDAASHTGVEHVRENIIENVRFTPITLKFKVFIIDEVHMLSASAFNALLKTLEEPPPHALFILATTELHKVPSTIVSRCQRFDFRRIAVPDLVARLAHLIAAEGRRVDQEVILEIARVASGSLRDAESLLGQVFAVTDGEIGSDQASIILPHSEIGLALEFLSAALRRDAGGALKIVARIAEEGVEPLRFADDCLAVLRKILLLLLERDQSAITGEFDSETEKAIVRLSGELDLRRVSGAIELLLVKRQQLKTLDAGILPLELLAVELSLEGAKEIGSLPEIRSPITTPKEIKSPREIQSPAPPLVKKKAAAASESKPESSSKKNFKTTLADVRGRWNDFIRAVGEVNHSLPFILNVSAPLGVENGAIVVGSRYPFHCDRLNEEKHYSTFLGAAEKIFGEALGVRAELSDDLPIEPAAEVASLTEPAESDPALKAVLDALGGKVV